MCAIRTKYIKMDEPISVKIGRIIRKHRKHKNISQTELGDQIGVAHTTISRYETGKLDVPISCLPQISSFCDFSTGEYIQAFCTDQEVVKALKKIAFYMDTYTFEDMGTDIQTTDQSNILNGIPGSVKSLVVSAAQYMDEVPGKDKKAVSNLVIEMVSIEKVKEQQIKRLLMYIKLLNKDTPNRS